MMEYEHSQMVMDAFTAAAQHISYCSDVLLGEMQSPFIQTKARMYPDGNQWCALYGNNLQEGIAGFGDTPAKAAADFDKNWFHQTIGGEK